MTFPALLVGDRDELKPRTIFILSHLRPKFLILPPTTLEAQNPSTIPREHVRLASECDTIEESTSNQKKAGRRSKAEKVQKMKNTASVLADWLDGTSAAVDAIPGLADPAGAAGIFRSEAGEMVTTEENSEGTTHNLLLQRPMASLVAYRAKKAAATTLLQSKGRHDIVDRAGRRVLQRLKEIDASAAERGLEIGTEGGEFSALSRVENAVESKDVLRLLEGSGLS